MKRVLVTGANGFIGRHAIPLLIEKEFEVHCVDIKLPEEKQPYINWYNIDLMDSGKMMVLMSDIKPTHLLHFAWFAVPGKYWTSIENIRCVEGSLNLLRAFQKSGGQRIVMAGTCAEYDWRYGYCSEHITPLVPLTLYGTCKNALQHILKDFSQVTGLSSAWGRIFFLYGPHENPNRLVSSVILNLIQGKTAPCSHGNQIRDFLYVEDVASAFVSLLESDVRGTVNIASGKPTSLKEMIYGVADMLEKHALVQLGAVSTPQSEPPVLLADVSRLNREVGWHPQVSMVDGLRKTVEWWKMYVGGSIVT
ncbi:MAG: NAD(P)-dependent oxidoreductase [Proteobacteria bacterium]|nr:NAD(P)-dependent oxidoreductase [Pseudomonadota bacterium]